jgi:hypothetical protein
LALLALNEFLMAPGVLRAALRGTLSIAVFAVMALWIRLNRAALDAEGWCACAHTRIRIRVIDSRQPVRPGPVPVEAGIPREWLEAPDESRVTSGV